MDEPRNATELQGFIGCINYYWDMWPSRAHILKPLPDQSGLKKHAPINWTNEMQQSIDKMCSLMAYPDHTKQFDIYTDASDFLLGAWIVQEGMLVAYFSRKLYKSQQNYTVMEKDMLSIVATLEEFQGMFLDADIHVSQIIKTDIWHLQNAKSLSLVQQGQGILTYIALYQGPPQYTGW